MAQQKEPLKKIQEGIADSSKRIQEGVSDTTRDFWLASLGIVSSVEEETNKIYDRFVKIGNDLVAKGEKFEKRDKEKGVYATLNKTVKFVEEKFNAAVKPFEISPRKDILELNKKVDKLTESVTALTAKLEKSADKSAKVTRFSSLQG